MFFKNKKSDNNTLLIAGLGNPGSKYENNRHNAGYLFADYFINRYQLNEYKKKKNFLYSLNKNFKREIVLIKPTTFMNLSGRAITSAMAFFKIRPQNILVIFDDVALPFGKLRIREKGSHGGHNGLKNIQTQLGRDDYKRIRMGIGAPEHTTGMISHVLGDFNHQELQLLNDKLFPIIDDAVKLIIDDNIKEAMNKYNGINCTEN